MNVPILNLERLGEPVVPRKKENIIIHFGQQAAESSTEEAKRPKLLVDKRKQSNVDRDLILRRLAEKKLLLVNNPKLVEPAPLPPVQVEEMISPKKQTRITLETPLPIPVETVIEEETKQEREPDAEIDVEKELENTIAEIESRISPTTEEEVPIILPQPVVVPPTALPAAVAPKRKLKLKIVPGKIVPVQAAPIDLTTIAIRDQAVADRLPKEKEKVIVKAPTYYMANRKIYMQKIAQLFQPYRKELLDTSQTVSCDTLNTSSEFNLLSHQKIVRDYLNLYTPYRGLLLYHSLGSGKSCSSIAIAEGMKSNKRVYVLTPASLKMNFFTELKKCGDELYKKNQFWEFVATEGRPDLIPVLAKALSLSTESIEKNKGAWLVNIKKPANFTELTTEDQEAVDNQLNEMIRSKYIDLNYNGLNQKKIDALTQNGEINPFDNAVVLVDEAHDFVSRIVNKIKKPDSISYRLYEALMSATNAKIVLITGTPIINYPNEIGILFNILRGYITTWIFTVNVKTTEKITTDTLLDMFEKENFKTYDYVEYSGNKLTITRNPFGFINAKKRGMLKGTQREPRPKKGGNTTKKTNPKKQRITHKNKQNHHNKEGIAEKLSYPKEEYDDDEITPNDPYNGVYGVHEGGAAGEVFERYNGVAVDEAGNLSDADFQRAVVRILSKYGVETQTQVEIVRNKALPDDADSFLSLFVNSETGEAQKMNLFQRRILGLTSYFRSAQEELMPSYVKTAENDIFHIVKTPMSSHQFGVYEKIRKVEADRERNAKKRKRMQPNNELFTISSTYRIFSRAACNFVFPDEITRPVPEGKEDIELNEHEFDALPEPTDEEAENPSTGEENAETETYAKRIQTAMDQVNVLLEGTQKSKFLDKDVLDTISPKMAAVLENLTDEKNRGLHLLYSHFRTIEGIGIMRLILLANGFAEFKIKKGEDWEIVEDEADADKPRFMLYTGTETAEEKEILRNVYNSNWDYIPASLATRLREKYENNFYGEAIKIIMITASGAQGINLKNTRFVHILEPYWHMVRIEQVVGRARRICSHQDLPEELRTVEVFLYISVLSEEQKIDEQNIELRIRDISRIDKKTPVTTDESLYEIASVKKKINNQILRAVKETAVDCQLYASVKKKAGKEEEPLVCYGFGKVESNRFSSYPSLESDQNEKEDLNVKVKRWTAKKVTINGTTYAYNESTQELYDYDSYERAAADTGIEPILIGRLVNERGMYRIVPV